jgi:hypothetical protein
MATTLNIVHGATPVSLTSANVTFCDYTPRPGRRGQLTVTEQIKVIFTGAITTVQATLRNIERAFAIAERHYDTGRGDRCYLTFQPDGAAAAYRSEIVRPVPGLSAGDVILPDNWLSTQSSGQRVIITINVTRVNSWEANTESELVLSNGGGSGAGGRGIYLLHGAALMTTDTFSYTSPATITDSGDGFGVFGVGDIISLRGDTNDGIYSIASATTNIITVTEPITTSTGGVASSIYDIQNYTHIDSAVIDGDLPAVSRIEFTNNDAGADLETVWIGQNYLSGPETLAHILEIDDSDTGSSTGDATCGSGWKRIYAISDTEAKITGWTIPTETLTAADGGYFKVFARFSEYTNITAVKWRLKILYSGTVIWQGGQVKFDDTYALTNRIVRELDTIQLPPFIPENSVPTDLTLELWGIRDAGAINVNVDCLILMPLDGYRRLRSLDGIAQNSVLKDDGVTNTYYQEVSSQQVRDIAAVGDQIVLWPNEDNRLYFLMHSHTTGVADHDRTASLRIYYRPRKITV